jgi:two-component sensor histidine kinase
LKEINHRVKNNLIAILGLLLAEGRHTPAGGKQFVERTIANLTQRIDGLLQVHQMLSDSQWLPMRLTDLAERIIQTVLASAPSGCQLLLDIHPSAIEVSPRQANNLALVLNELATNTVKHARGEPDTIQITVRATAEEDMIRLEYHDSGPGYPADVLRMECSSVGMNLIQELATKTLRGKVVLSNQDGAQTTLWIKSEAKDST